MLQAHVSDYRIVQKAHEVEGPTSLHYNVGAKKDLNPELNL